MKKHNIIIGLILIVLSSSCSDFLDRVPLDFVSPDNFLTNEAQSQILLNGVYAKITMQDDSYRQTFPIHEASLTDDVYDSQPWHETTEWARGQGTAQSALPNWFWKTNYQGVARANVFISSIKKATFSSSLIPRLTAEAKFLRAWYYNQLITYFGDVPLILEPGDLTNGQPTRTPKDEIVAQILQDLEEAIPVLPQTYEDAKDAGRVTKGAAMGLKARVLLYQSRWAEAAQAAKEVMDLKQYTLFPDYQGLFLEKNEEAASKSEIMFQRYYTKDIDPSFLSEYIGLWPALAPTKQLVDCYYMSDGLPITESDRYDRANPFMNRDPRLKATIFYPGSKYFNNRQGAPGLEYVQDSVPTPEWILSVTGFRCKKHLDGKIMENKDEGRNAYLMRYGEILLTYAEAQNEASGPDKSVYNAIDQLRIRVGMITLTKAMPNLSKEKMREVIRNERRVELAIEGLRWPDIRRWRIGEKVMVDAIGLDMSLLKGGQYPGDGKGETKDWIYKDIVVDKRQFNPARDYLLPIPQEEMTANPNMTQNPNY